MIVWSLAYQGSANTLRMLEKLKVLGFQYATHAGISLGIDDLRVPPKKRDELRAADILMNTVIQGEYRGERTAIEGLQGVIDTWHRTSENVKDHVVEYFKATDILNPVYMMSFSGARGNISQVRQLAGMRGLMSDAQGTIIGFPIRSNFREGLTLTEYIISCYGARKGVVDTALRTADAGYLTRRLVDVAQHIVVRTGSCGTRKGVRVKPLYEYGKELVSTRERLVGRVLAADITHRGKLIARRNEPISPSMADYLSTLTSTPRHKSSKRRHHSRVSLPVRVRSPLTCALRHGICKLCYGWSLASQTMVSLGEAVGIMAGQSIGEPGTQLTMRTFHTGGVFTGAVEAEFRSPHAGYVTYPKPYRGCMVRTPSGRLGFFLRRTGFLVLTHPRGVQTRIQVPRNTALFVREGEFIGSNELLGLCDSMSIRTKERRKTTKIVFANSDGQVLKLGHGQDICDTPMLDQFNIERLEERLLRPPGWSDLTPTGATIKPPGKKRRIPRKKKGGKPRYPFQGARSIPWNSALAPTSVWVLAGTRLGPSNAVLPLYGSSGQLVDAGLPYRRSAVVGRVDMYIYASDSPHVSPPPALRIPPVAFSRMSATPTPFVRATQTIPTMGYTPCILAAFESVMLHNEVLILHTHENDLFIVDRPGTQLPRRHEFWQKALSERIPVRPTPTSEANGELKARSLGDKFRRPLLSRSPVTTPPLPPKCTRLMHLPAAFRTNLGGFFWSRPEFLNRKEHAGLLFFTPHLQFHNYGVQMRRLPRPLRIGVRRQRSSCAVLAAKSMSISAPTRTVASWVRAHDPLFTSRTLQGRSFTICALTYGLVQCSIDASQLKSPRRASHFPGSYIRVTSALRVNPRSLDTQAVYQVGQLPQPQPASTSFFNFPFTVVPSPGVTIRSGAFYAGWAYLPPAWAFRTKVAPIDSVPCFDHGFMQASQPLLLKGSHPPLSFKSFKPLVNQSSSVRTQALTVHLNLDRGQTSVHPSCNWMMQGSVAISQRTTDLAIPRAVLYLPTLRAILSFRHSALMCAFTERTTVYRIAQRVSIFTHAASPWFALVQPGRVAVPARTVDRSLFPTVYSLGSTLGVLYVATRCAMRYFAPPCYEKRSLQHVQFRALISQTPVYLCTIPQVFSLHALDSVQHTLMRAQAFDSVAVLTHVWTAYPPLWTKQVRTGHRFERVNIDCKVRISMAPLGILLRKSAYALRIAMKFITEKDLPVTLRSPIRPVTVPVKQYWSLGSQHALCAHTRSLFDTLPGRPNTLCMASDPTHIRVLTLPIGGETCRIDDSPEDAVVLLRPQDVAAYPIPADRPCRTYLGAMIRYGDELFDGYAIPVSGQVVSLTMTHIVIRRAQVVLHYEGTRVRVHDKQWISAGTPLLSFTYQRLVTGDIVQGIPKIEQLFEASKGDKAEAKLQPMAESIWNQCRRRLNSQHAVRRSLALMQREIIDRIQRIYLSQGVIISDKHMEVIVRRMTSWVRVTQPGVTGLFIGEVLSLQRMDAINLSTRPPNRFTQPLTLLPRDMADMGCFHHYMRWTPPPLKPGQQIDTLLFRGPRPRTRLSGHLFRHPKVRYQAYTGYSGRAFKYRPFYVTPFSKRLGTIWFQRTSKMKHILRYQLPRVKSSESSIWFQRTWTMAQVLEQQVPYATSKYKRYLSWRSKHRLYRPEYLLYAPERLVTQEDFLATCQPYIRGISAVAMDNESFLSAASFQETTRVLTRDSLFSKKDFLRGLKECVIVGDLIPAGTGLPSMIVYRLNMGSALQRDLGLSTTLSTQELL